MLTVAEIQRRVAERYALPASALQAGDQRRCRVRPRQLAMYLARRLTRQTLPQIGRRFQLTHATVIHAIRTIEALRLADMAIDADVRALISELTTPAAGIAVQQGA